MPNAVIADRKPKQTQLEPGKYYWCACGRSKNQPFCDGSHAGTGITPVAFQVAEKADAWLCMCKQTGNAPYCDGTHANLPTDVTELDTPTSA